MNFLLPIEFLLSYYDFRGVAARALHLSRAVEKPSGMVTYIVVLEGLCRFNVQELSARGTYNVAHISSLDLSSAGKAGSHAITFCAQLVHSFSILMTCILRKIGFFGHGISDSANTYSKKIMFLSLWLILYFYLGCTLSNLTILACVVIVE